jgi:hypothetical protein
MSVENLPDPRKAKNKEDAVAEALMLGLKQLAEATKHTYFQGTDLLWNQEGWDVAAANRVLRKLDEEMPGYSILLFQLHALAGQMLAILGESGILASSPVSYTVNQSGELILDETEKYPTEE